MYLNEFADGLTPKDMTATDEFASLLDSAADLGIAHDRSARYLSRHTVVRGQRFHFLEDVPAPPIQAGEEIQVDLLASLKHLLPDEVQVIPQKFHVQHDRLSLGKVFFDYHFDRLKSTVLSPPKGR